MKAQLPLLVALASSLGIAQQPPAAPSFEVASIRPATPGARDNRVVSGPTSLLLTNMNLQDCLLWAWEIQGTQLQGPAWLDGPRFTVTARTASPATEDQLRLMLRALLTDRFGLKLHQERKEVQTYSLILGKSGARFHDAGPKDASRFIESKVDQPAVFRSDKTGLIAEHAHLSELADKISEPLKRPVIDKTGLTGRYDIRIDIVPYLTNEGGDDGRQNVDPATIIFTALQGQLGLKVEPGRDPVNYLVIDAGNKLPAEN